MENISLEDDLDYEEIICNSFFFFFLQFYVRGILLVKIYLVSTLLLAIVLLGFVV